MIERHAKTPCPIPDYDSVKPRSIVRQAVQTREFPWVASEPQTFDRDDQEIWAMGLQWRTIRFVPLRLL